MLRDFSFRRYHLASSLAILFFVILTLYGLQSFRQPQGDTLSGTYSTRPALSPPSDYYQAPTDLEYCSQRFGLEYLQSLSNTSTNYCNANSGSSLTCFRSQTAEDRRIDTFCVSGPSSFDVNSKKFGLSCELRKWATTDIARGIQGIDRFHTYWYETGPQYIFNNHVLIDPTVQVSSKDGASLRKFSILVKREDHVNNLWHSLMEIAAAFMTLDVLRMSQDPATGRPYFSTEDIENTQVVILDDHADGPYYELWTLFASRPIIRLMKKNEEIKQDAEKIIIPLPGGANPMWQGDWKVHNCQHSALWRTFSQRVLNFYKVNDKPKSDSEPLVLTFVDRKEKRRLVDKEQYIENLRSKFPDVEVRSVDFASLPFAQQLDVARRTDILVGVHGAGLTHGMFMRPGSAIVEILPHGLEHKGFRNMAKLLDHHYFSSHATKDLSVSGDWQTNDVVLEEDRFMGLVEVAVKSMYNRGLLNSDITK